MSPASAVGLMQVMPATASSIAASNGLGYSLSNLFDSTLNLASQGHRVVKRRAAARRPLGCNSRQVRPDPVDRKHPVLGDALLRARSAPANREPASLTAIAQHRWPGFPVRR